MLLLWLLATIPAAQLGPCWDVLVLGAQGVKNGIKQEHVDKWIHCCLFTCWFLPNTFGHCPFSLVWESDEIFIGNAVSMTPLKTSILVEDCNQRPRSVPSLRRIITPWGIALIVQLRLTGSGGDREEGRGGCRILSQDLLKPEGYHCGSRNPTEFKDFVLRIVNCLKLNRVVLKVVVFELCD